MIRKHFYFEGRVQGVGFRYKAMYLASQLDLTGWVDNLWDGRVEMEVQGGEAAIDKMLARLSGDRFIRIEGMEVADAIVSGQTDWQDRPRQKQVMKKVTVDTFGVDYPEPEMV